MLSCGALDPGCISLGTPKALVAALAKASRFSLGSFGAFGFRARFFDDKPAGVSSAETPPNAVDSPSSPGGKVMAVVAEP